MLSPTGAAQSRILQFGIRLTQAQYNSHNREHGGTMKISGGVTIASVATVAALTIVLISACSKEQPTVRGKYLVTIAGCNDCHTSGYFFGKPDMARYLGGSDVGFEIPGLGAFAGRNITPDRETGIALRA